ncbi:MAG TPA: carboxypeptidase-like regulatory domain-containing protein, partial [Isosphaeraceae bacterium]|nr:carboxypeptidase-like regulatory domain-containing protein [Isosphaeraceae bacterium]
RAVVTTDDQGRFEIPAIAEGHLTIACRPQGDAPYRVSDNSRTLIRADRPNEIKLAVQRALPVEGTVVDRQSGAPIAGVRITSYMQQTGSLDHGFTNDRGRFAMLLLPSQYQLRLASLPPSYAMSPNVENRQINVVQGASPNTVDPFEVVKAEPPLRGRVIDESGRPMAGASVEGNWEQWVSNLYGAYESLATTDSSGNFQLERIPPLVEVKLSAKRGALATLEPLLVWASDEKPVTLRVTRAATSAIRGRVLGTDGRPVANASVRVQYRKDKGPRGWTIGSIHFDGIDEIRTAADGTFQTPRQLGLALDYRSQAIAEGFVSESTDFLKPASVEFNVLSDLMLRRALTLRTVTGRVVDRQGRALAGVTVLQSGDGPRRSRALTDALGRFQIGGVADGPAFLFAEKPEFRFGGSLIGAGNKAVELVLDRADQPPRTVLKTLPWSTSRDEERALVRAMLDPIAVPSELRQRIPNDFQLRRLLRPLAWVDPPRLLAVLASPAIVRDESILDATAIALWEMKGPEAADMVDTEPDPCARAYGLLALEKVAAADDRKLHGDLLTRAAREATRVTDPAEKLLLLGRAADRLIEVGESDRAIPILREGWKLAQTIKRDQCPQSIAVFAPALASTDLASAVALVEGKDGSTPLMNNTAYAQSILGEIAWRIAAANPAEAERLLTKINAAVARSGLERHLLRACSRMAPRDLDRAGKLAALLGQAPQPNNNINRKRITNRAGPGLALYAQLIVAKSIAESKPAEARKQVEEVIAELRRRAIDEPSQPGEPNSACLIAGCLPLVEQLMPDRVAEYFWLALACRAPRCDELDFEQLRLLATLAGIVARYDRLAAEQVAGPVFDQVPVPSRTAFPGNKWAGFENVFQALACLDPRRAADLVNRLPEEEKLPESPPQKLQRVIARGAIRRMRFDGNAQYPIKSMSRTQLAESLLLPIDRRRIDLLNSLANPWLLEPAGDIAQ